MITPLAIMYWPAHWYVSILEHDDTQKKKYDATETIVCGNLKEEARFRLLFF